MFVSYFGRLSYLKGGFATGFRHVEPSKDEPHLYKIKGTKKGMSMAQVPVSKSSLNQGDSFILFANKSLVWIWHGESSNPDEKARANSAAEEMCTQGTAVIIESSDAEGENAEFWAYLGDGTIQPAEGGDEEIKDFVPVLFRIKDKGTGGSINAEKVAEAQPIKRRFGPPTSKIARSLLDDDDVFLLDAGWEIFLWMGKACDKSEKLAGMSIAENYMVRLRMCELLSCSLQTNTRLYVLFFLLSRRDTRAPPISLSRLSKAVGKRPISMNTLNRKAAYAVRSLLGP